MSYPPAQLTTNAQKISETIVSAFTPLPVFKYLTGCAPYEENVQDYVKKVTVYTKQSYIQIQESEDHQAIAIWLEPFSSVPPTSNGAPDPFVAELKEKVAAVTPDYLKTGNYWYLFYLARNRNATTKGVVTAVVKPYLERALAEGRPAVLEAANEHARDVYLHWGFKVISEVVVGKGKVNVEGYPDENGEGITLWFMVFNGKD